MQIINHDSTHFIEQFKDVRHPPGKIMQSPQLMDISKLNAALKLTDNSADLKTVAVWKIKLKPHVALAQHDNEVKAIIIS